MSRPFKLDELLDPPAREAFEAFLRERHRTVEAAHEWCEAQGLVVSPTAVHNWTVAWKEREQLDQIRARSGAAARFAAAVEAAGPGDLARATLQVFQRQVFDFLVQADGEGGVDPKQILPIATAIRQLAGAEKTVEDLKAKFDAAVEAATGGGRKKQVTREDLLRVRQQMFG